MASDAAELSISRRSVANAPSRMRIKQHRIFLTGSGIVERAKNFLRDNGCVIETGSPADTPAVLVRKLSAFHPDALIVRQGTISGEVQDAAPDLKVICKHGVGIDNIDVAGATKRGIPVLYTPGASTNVVAEHTLALLLALLRRIPQGDRQLRSGMFDKSGYSGSELREKTVGLIGYGRIGRRVAQLLAPFEVEILVFHPSNTEETLPRRVFKLKEVDEVLRRSDIVTLHCPLTASTHALINAESIMRMKQGALLINTARGQLVDEHALVEALHSGRLGGAALDVFATEPLPPDHPLLALDQVVLTAHVAGSSDASLFQMGMQAAVNVLSVLMGEPVDGSNILNPEVLSPGLTAL
jgi:D-3-phosphoglycerate dehydrogenase / 2-oxoglutarate reductase